MLSLNLKQPAYATKTSGGLDRSSDWQDGFPRSSPNAVAARGKASSALLELYSYIGHPPKNVSTSYNIYFEVDTKCQYIIKLEVQVLYVSDKKNAVFVNGARRYISTALQMRPAIKNSMIK